MMRQIRSQYERVVQRRRIDGLKRIQDGPGLLLLFRAGRQYIVGAGRNQQQWYQDARYMHCRTVSK